MRRVLTTVVVRAGSRRTFRRPVRSRVPATVSEPVQVTGRCRVSLKAAWRRLPTRMATVENDTQPYGGGTAGLARGEELRLDGLRIVARDDPSHRGAPGSVNQRLPPGPGDDLEGLGAYLSERPDRAGRRDLADRGAVVVGEPEVAVRPGGDADGVLIPGSARRRTR